MNVKKNPEHLLKPGEKIPANIKIIQTDKKFPGDCRVETECRHCGFRTALTAFETLCQVMLFGRNDSNNPQYRFGLRYVFKYYQICFRDNCLYLEPQIRGRIIQELIEDDKM